MIISVLSRDIHRDVCSSTEAEAVVYGSIDIFGSLLVMLYPSTARELMDMKCIHYTFETDIWYIECNESALSRQDVSIGDI